MISRLEPATTVLLVVDVQTKLAAAMPPETLDRLVRNTVLLLEAARLLGVRVVATEQYAKGLGPTLPPVAEKLAALSVTPIDKRDFSALDDVRVADTILSARPGAVVVVGMESHVCVYQSARDLAARGLATHIVQDAVASRREENRLAGIALAERAGATATVTEAVVFDWLRRAEGDAFKQLSSLLR